MTGEIDPTLALTTTPWNRSHSERFFLARLFADEYDVANERGEVRGLGNIPGENVSPLADIGLTGKDFHEAPLVHDAKAADFNRFRRCQPVK